MKYTAKDRALAIRICHIAAMSPTLHECYGEIAELLGLEHELSLYDIPGVNLAYEAWCACSGHATGDGGERDGAAEALLRDGWSSGDPIVRLGGGR